MAKGQGQRQMVAWGAKRVVKALRFQAHHGLKQFWQEEHSMFHKLVDVEINIIARMGLARDLLALKSFVKGVKQRFSVTPTPGKGDFTKSPTALALGIASINDINNMKLPLITWSEKKKQKFLSVCYQEEYCDKIVNWAKANGFNVSTYLGRPVLKFRKLYITLEEHQINICHSSG